jgi:hypothetical protein
MVNAFGFVTGLLGRGVLLHRAGRADDVESAYQLSPDRSQTCRADRQARVPIYLALGVMDRERLDGCCGSVYHQEMERTFDT